MKAIAPITSSQLKRMAFGASSLVVAAMTIGTTTTAAASQHKDTNDYKKNQGSVQNNKNQRNSRNYNITYNINYYFNDHSNKPQQTKNKPKNNKPTSHKNTHTQSTSNHNQKDTKLTSNHNHQKKQNRVFTETRWVYDPRLCRWVEIGLNKSTKRWELTHVNDRNDSRNNNPQDNRNYSYWYND